MQKIQKQLLSIFDINEEECMKKRYTWVTHSQQRSKFLKGLKDQELTGKEYSDKVVEFDKQFVGGL